MSRPLFEHITQPEKPGLPLSLKAAVLFGATVFHALGLTYLFTAKFHYKFLKLPPRVQPVELVPPLPEGALSAQTPAGGSEGALSGRPQDEGLPEAGPNAARRSDRSTPRSDRFPGLPPRPGSESGGAPSFALRAPIEPGPLSSRETRPGSPLGDISRKYKPVPGDSKFYPYTVTDIWGKRPAGVSSLDSGENPGGPLGSSYGLSRSSTGNKVIFRGKDALTGQGYDLTPWAQVLVGIIQRNWFLPATDASKAWGKVGITVVIEKSGVLSAVRVVNSADDQILVRAALEAIKKSVPLPRMPEDFPGTRLEAYLLFDYHEIR